MMDLAGFARAFAAGMEAADARRPVARNRRTGVPFAPGLGPHAEDAAIGAVLEAMAEADNWPRCAVRRQVPYPARPRTRADLLIEPPQAAPVVLEAKLLRLLGDNGKLNDNMLMHILSPYPTHRSAVTDVAKLARSGFAARRWILIFGYDTPDLPADPALRAFELLAGDHATLGAHHVARTGPLVHPVHRQGFAAVWEVQAAA